MKILGLPNYIASPICTASAGSLPGLEPAGMEAYWLQTEEPSDKSRLLSLDPLYSRWFFNFGYVSVSIDGLTAINVNFSPNGKYRFVGLFGTQEPSPKTKAANAILASTNVTGAVTDVDEPISTPDNAYIGPTVTSSDWEARFGFSSLNQTPVPGDSMCQIVAVVRMFESASSGQLTYPEIGVEVWESGVFLATLGTRAVSVSSVGGQVVVFAFDPADFVDPALSNLEVRFFSEPGESVSGHTYCKLDSFQLYYEEAGDVDMDSGWIDVPSTTDTPQAPSLDVHFYPETPWTDVRLAALLVLDDQIYVRSLGNKVLGPSGVPVGLANANPPQFVEAGVVAAGAAMSFQYGLRKNGGATTTRPMSEEVQGNTGGGQTYAADSYRFRDGEPLELLVTREEGNALLDKLGWRRGHSGAFYLSIEPDVDPIYQIFSSAWVTLAEIGALMPLPDSHYDPGSGMLYTIDITVREKV